MRARVASVAQGYNMELVIAMLEALIEWESENLQREDVISNLTTQLEEARQDANV